MQQRYLDKRLVILLLNRNEHANDIAQQVCATFGHAVEKNGLFQPGLFKVLVQLVQIVFFC